MTALEALEKSRLLAIIRGTKGGPEILEVVGTLIDHEITEIEISLTTPGTLGWVRQAVDEYGAAANIGIGTVRTPKDVTAAADAGAAYVLSAGLRRDVVKTAQQAGISIIPGVMTPTEIATAFDAGVSAVKLFPAHFVGVAYLRSLLGPYPDGKFLAVGGISPHNAAEWLDAGAFAVGAAQPLVADAADGGSLDELAVRARAMRASVMGAS